MQERLVHSQICGLFLAFLYTLCKKDPSETLPTIGFNVETVKAKKYTFDLWVDTERSDYRQDVGGQDKYRSMWRHYYTGTHVTVPLTDQYQSVIFVVDSSDRARLDQVKEELHRMAIDDQLNVRFRQESYHRRQFG